MWKLYYVEKNIRQLIMTSKWLNQILLCAILQCMVFTATADPTITINGNSSSPQTFKINDVVKINCTVSPNYTSIAGFNLQKGGRTYYRIEKNSNTGEVNKTITCDDNTSYKCYGIFNRSREYSSNIYVIAECPPDWSASMKERSFFFSPWSLNKYFDFPIFGQPQPTYTAQKLTSTGFQDVSPNIDVQSYTNKLRLYFRTYSDEYHGIYRLLANNSLGKFATNITFRGSTLPAKNVVAWSTSPDSVHVEWVAGELFDTKPRYYVYYKIETWTTNPQYVYDIGSTVTYTFNSAKPNTTYYFMIAVATKYGTSSYSNIAQATSLSPGDPPQAKPIYEPTDSTTSKSTVVGQSVASDCTNCEEDVPTFEAGIGLGVGIGLILLIISVLGTVIYFKKSLIKREEVPEANQNHPAESEPGMYMNVRDHTYEKLSHPNRGVSYDNNRSEG